MGVNLIVIVENSKGVSLQEFRNALLKTRYGKYLWSESKYWKDRGVTPWQEFEFEGKRYFSWVFTPREHHYNLWRTCEKETQEHEINRIFLFKALLAAEKIAGGLVYLGHDAVDMPSPCEVEPFRLPVELDYLWPDWRKIARKSKLPKGFSLGFCLLISQLLFFVFL